MPDLRNDEQRRRLEHEYARKTDEELKDLADAEYSLTDVAREALRTEITHRGLSISVLDDVPAPAAVPLLPIVRVYRDLPDALIAQSILDSAGIECFLFDENIIRLNWLWSYAVHCVKLRVADEDAADAAQLLDQPRLESFEIEGVGTHVEPRCPNCQSLDISFRPLIKPIAYGLLFFDPEEPEQIPIQRQVFTRLACPPFVPAGCTSPRGTLRRDGQITILLRSLIGSARFPDAFFRVGLILRADR